MADTTLVIGAGVIGLAAAVALARDGHDVIVVEGADTIGTGISSRNSEVIHGGMYYETGSLKAKHCVRGRRMLYAYADKRGIPYRKIGKLIVATTERERLKIEGIHAQGQANGVERLELIGGSTARIMEPNLTCVAAIHSPETGIIDSHALMLSLQGELEDHGGMIAFRTPVRQIMSGMGGGWTVVCDGPDGGRFHVRNVINAAGLGAWKVAAATEGYAPARVPKLYMAKGHYFSCSGKAPFSRLIYPVPADGGLGVHLTFDQQGRMKFGPDVEWVDEESYDVDETRASNFYARIRSYWAGLPEGALHPDYTGIRPKLSGPGEPQVDFYIDGPRDHELPGLVHLFGIESPGLTASLSFALHIAKIIRVNRV